MLNLPPVNPDLSSCLFSKKVVFRGKYPRSQFSEQRLWHQDTQPMSFHIKLAMCWEECHLKVHDTPSCGTAEYCAVASTLSLGARQLHNETQAWKAGPRPLLTWLLVLHSHDMGWSVWLAAAGSPPRRVSLGQPDCHPKCLGPAIHLLL